MSNETRRSLESFVQRAFIKNGYDVVWITECGHVFTKEAHASSFAEKNNVEITEVRKPVKKQHKKDK